MHGNHATATHGGPLVRIDGRLPSNAKAVLARTGAFEREGGLWCFPYDWKRCRAALNGLGVPITEEGEPTVPPEPVVTQRTGPRQASMTMEGSRIRLQGDLPVPMHKAWLGSSTPRGHVGMTPWAIEDFLAACRDQRIEVGLDTAAEAMRQATLARRKAVEAVDGRTADFAVPLAQGSLRAYQQRAVAFLHATGGRALIGADVGLGKTVEAIAYKRSVQAKRVVVVCPSIVKGNWRDEIRRFDGQPSTILDGFNDRRLTAYHFDDPWVITGYDTLLNRGQSGHNHIGWLDALQEWKPDLVILDESHMCKNRESQRGRAAALLAAYAKRVVLMSGTLMSNSPMDYWNQLNAIQPGFWGTWFEFGVAFCDAQERSRWVGKGRRPLKYWDMGGSSNADTLRRYMQHARLLQPKAEVAPELPEQIRIPRTMELLLGFRLEYDAVLKDHREAMAKLRGVEAGDPAKEDALLASQRGKVMATILKLRQISGRGRIDSTVELVMDLVEAGKRPVVFAYFQDSLHGLRDGLEAKGLKVGYIDGSVSRPQRDAVREAFTTGRHQVLVGQTEAAGVGINLHEASDTTVTHELTYRPLDIIQTEGRCVLEGQQVFTPQMGLVDIQDVRVGDSVLSKDGKWVKVVDAWNRTVKKGSPITEISYTRFSDSLKLTPDHRVLISRDGKTLEWKEASTIVPGDLLVLPRPQSINRLHAIRFEDRWRLFSKEQLATYRHCLECDKPPIARRLCATHYHRWKVQTPVEERDSRTCRLDIPNPRMRSMPESIEVDDELLFLFGWYLAEGWVGYNDRKLPKYVGLCGHVKERPILERLGRTVSRWGIKTSVIDSKRTKSCEMRIHNAEMARWFAEWFGIGAHEKRLPLCLMSLPVTQAEVLLHGYLQGDGHRRAKDTTWVSVSKTLAYQMALLAAQCGHSPSLRLVNDRSNQGQWVGGYSHGKARGISTDSHILIPVDSVHTSRLAKGAKVFDLTVEEGASFVVGFAAVHNCHRLGIVNPTVHYYCLGERTVDSAILEALQRKLAAKEALDQAGNVEDDVARSFFSKP